MRIKSVIMTLTALIALLLTACSSLLDIAIAAAGTDGPATVVPDTVLNFDVMQSNNIMRLSWDLPERKKLDANSGFKEAAEVAMEETFGLPNDPKGYEIWRRSKSGAEESWTSWKEIEVIFLENSSSGSVIDLLGGDESMYSYDRDVSFSVIYQYRIAAFNGKGPSKFIVSREVKLSNERLTNLRAAFVDNKVRISWDKIENRKYRVDRGVRSVAGSTSIQWKVLGTTSENFFTDDPRNELTDSEQTGMLQNRDNSIHYRVFLIDGDQRTNSATTSLRL